MRLLVVYNPGKFAQKMITTLRGQHDVYVFPVDRIREHWLSNISEHFKSIEDLILDAVLYISGETRDVYAMYALNFWLPTQFLDFAVKRRLKFVYLSSLAVWAGNVSDSISLISQRQPMDTYGYTKWAFDHYVRAVREADPECHVSGLYPDSFYSGNGRSSIETYKKLIKKWRFLKYLRFSGCLSYAPVEKIIDGICAALASKVGYDQMIADCMLIKDIKIHSQNARWQIPVPRLPLWFFRGLQWFLPQKFLFKVRMVMRGIRYV